jgi:RNA polymerase sigma-70 factor (ECF subfamily)
MALMCFQASRFDARIGENGDMVLYDDQDTSLWNADLVGKGVYYASNAASGSYLTRYHLEANIAYWHTQKNDSQEKWENILQLHNQLLQLHYSPIAALNRTFALSKARGKKEAIVQAEKLQLTSNHFYYALLGELYTDIDNTKAIANFEKAMALAATKPERAVIQKKIDRLN